MSSLLYKLPPNTKRRSSYQIEYIFSGIARLFTKSATKSWRKSLAKIPRYNLGRISKPHVGKVPLSLSGLNAILDSPDQLSREGARNVISQDIRSSLRILRPGNKRDR